MKIITINVNGICVTETTSFIGTRHKNHQEPRQYTWWLNHGQAWTTNLDYQILSANLQGTVKSAYVYKDKRFSDHAPLIVEYQL
ncbi:hypothetical protein [Bathymodiolus thermophilus thioautotrophic gill symbiont]|uniref:hypothetical protein n=1 Tax=Bathymodiolus thermophilus thioautotrophic gill symbiont TaxID=2360 RepID=UPI000F0754D4|nr:hypothetical protein [Bathymodiolus thermophilus thioautotrophic gill symbiont]